MRPDDPKYSYTYAFYLNAQNRVPQAIQVLQSVVERKAASPDAYMLLARLLVTKGDFSGAKRVFEEAARNRALPEEVRQYFQMQASRFDGP